MKDIVHTQEGRLDTREAPFNALLLLGNHVQIQSIDHQNLVEREREREG